MCGLLQGSITSSLPSRAGACLPGPLLPSHMLGNSWVVPVACRHRASMACQAQLQQHRQWQTVQQNQHSMFIHQSCQQQLVEQQALQQTLGSRWFSSKKRKTKTCTAARDTDLQLKDLKLQAVIPTTDNQRQQQQEVQQVQQEVHQVQQQQAHHQQQLDQQLQQQLLAGNQSSSREGSESIRLQTRQLYSPLHYQILDFVQDVVPKPVERAEKQRLIQCVAVATARSFETQNNVKVQPFGSFVNGLSTWASDVDIVVTGIAKPSRITGGFSHNDKRLVYRALDRIASNLRKHKKISIRRMTTIRTARIPIIKLETSSRVIADISLGDTSGPKAANYVAQQVQAYPSLGPLVLVLKVYLRSCGLNEVANGGLSSYSLTNMVLAHLLEELKDGHDIYDLGETLYGFLLRFGDEFDTRRDAVSVSLGGVVSKQELGHLIRDDGSRAIGLGGERLLLEDPLTGRDVASGSHRVTAVQMAFSRAARRLEALVQRGSSSSINYLEGLFDVQRALDREASRRDAGAPWAVPGVKGIADEYTVIHRSQRHVDLPDGDIIEIPLEGDDFDDELEALLYPETQPRRKTKKKKG